MAWKEICASNLTGINRQLTEFRRFYSSAQSQPVHLLVGQCHYTIGPQQMFQRHDDSDLKHALERRTRHMPGSAIYLPKAKPEGPLGRLKQALESDPEKANLGDLRQNLPGHPLLFPQTNGSTPKASTKLFTSCCQCTLCHIRQILALLNLEIMDSSIPSFLLCPL